MEPLNILLLVVTIGWCAFVAGLFCGRSAARHEIDYLRRMAGQNWRDQQSDLDISLPYDDASYGDDADDWRER